jgi:putative ABC transport system permease protein
MPDYLALSPWQIALAALLLGLQVGLSLVLKLDMARSVLWAGLRMSVQLTLIGLILNWVFALQSLPLVLGVLTIMTLAAGQAAISRVKHPYRGIYRDSLLAIFVSSWLTTAYMIAVVSRPSPWYQPEYLIPLLGMVLGNGLSGMALGLDRFLSEAHSRRDEIETWLALGATRWEAAQDLVRNAVRTGMTPITQSMLASGLVSLPGMMTGQILGGVNPQQAVAYQIVIMFMISTSTALGTVGMVLLSWLRLFPAEHRLQLELGGSHA